MKSLSAITAFFILLILSNCRLPDSKPQPGIWIGQTPFGSFTFTIHASGTHITHFDFSAQSCSAGSVRGGTMFEGDTSFSPPIEIKTQSFSFILSGPPGVQFEGQFDATGETATGFWKAGRCEGEWNAITQK